MIEKEKEGKRREVLVKGNPESTVCLSNCYIKGQCIKNT